MPFVEEELKGRLIAVSEMEVNRSNVPTLPIAMTALVDVTFRHTEQGNAGPNVVEQIVTEFWFKSNKIKTATNAETPFWSFYDYDALLQKVVHAIRTFISPKKAKFKITRMDLESSELAVHITFEFFHDYKFCYELDEYEEPVKLLSNVCIKTECETATLRV